MGRHQAVLHGLGWPPGGEGQKRQGSGAGLDKSPRLHLEEHKPCHPDFMGEAFLDPE